MRSSDADKDPHPDIGYFIAGGIFAVILIGLFVAKLFNWI